MSAARGGTAGALRRFLRPATVAVVGASERQERAANAILSMRTAGVKLHLVNPARSHVFGQVAHPDLASIGQPVDAVLSLVPAAAAPQVAADARAAGAGGVVVVAGGFAEDGPDGAALQRRLRDAAGAMPVLGPNCNGFITPALGARLSGAPRALGFPDGHLGAVTHSGALLGVLGLAAAERSIGFSTLVSTGNEMSLDMADIVDFLADDEDTRCIALVVEAIRRPGAFFAAVRRALTAGKPVVALKLGRSERGRRIATSHTGALAGQAWAYDAAFRQHGIAVAQDVVDLMDRVTLLAQLPPARWSRVEGLAIASLSGGWSALAGDVCAQEGLDLPELSDLAGEINTILPPRATVNPLDMTGFVMGRADLIERVVDVLGSADGVDAVLLQWFLDETAGEGGRAFVDAAVAAAARLDKPVILGSVEDGHPGEWARELPARGVGLGRGLRATVRGLRTMRDFTMYTARPPATPPPVRPVPRPAAEPVATDAGPMLPFDVSMDLLAAAGVPVAPYAVAGPGTAVPDPGFGPPYVVKLADVPHRSDIGAVRLGVAREDLAAVVAELRCLARGHGVPQRVVIQPHLRVDGEAFVGVQGDSGLGPMVVFGVGGVFVELLGKVAGGLAPLTAADADAMLEEMEDTGVFRGARGRRPWNRDRLVEILTAVGAFAAGTSQWLRSADINPLAFTEEGFAAVDALILSRTP